MTRFVKKQNKKTLKWPSLSSLSFMYNRKEGTSIVVDVNQVNSRADSTSSL